MNFFRIGAFIILFITSSTARSQESSPLTSLTEWEYRWNNDSTWKTSPLSYDLPDRNGDTVLWLRTTLPAGNWNEPALLLTQIDHFFELYLDDSLSYAFGAEEFKKTGRNRILLWHAVHLPDRSSGRRMVLRIWSDHKIGVAEVRIGSMHDVINRISVADLDQVILGSLFVLLGLTGFVILFQRRHDRKTIASFSLLSANLGFLTVFQTEPIQIFFRFPMIFDYLNLEAVFLLPVSLCYFFEKVFGAGWRGIVRKLWQVHLGYAIFTTIVAQWGTRYLEPPFFVLTLLSTLILIVTAVQESRKGNPEAKIFTIGIIVFAGFLFRDLLMGLELIPGWRLMNHWGALAFLGALVMIIERRFSDAQRLLQEKILALGVSEQRLRFMVENLPRGAVYVDGDRIYLNKAAEEITGYSRDEMTTIEAWSRLLFGDRYEIVRKGYEDEKRKDFPAPKTLPVIRKDGQLRQIEFVGYRDEPGEVWLLHDVTDRKKAEKALRASEAELRKLAGHLQDVREAERTHIAREIHDELGQYLTGLKMDISMMEDLIREQPDENSRRPLMEKLAKTTTLLDSTVQSVRKIASDLRPIVLDNLGLLAAIEWQAEDFQNRTGIACECHLPTDPIPLDKERATAVFRILQESLTNVMRHAGATRVTVAFGRDTDQYFMEIKDNGKGIVPADLHKSRSFGVIGIKERSVLLGGKATIEGEPGRGTTVTLTIPFERSRS